jgi:peptidoglycan/xylan/chitin deacetylase (PgdA/CDA1 family)
MNAWLSLTKGMSVLYESWQKGLFVKVILSVDDGCQLDLKVAKLADKYRINDVIFYLPADLNSVASRNRFTPLTPSQASYLARNYEIGSHTVTHPLLTRISLEQARSEIVESKQMLENLYDQNITKFCYPRGYTNSDLQVMVRDAGYYSARGVLVGYIHQSENPYHEQTSVHVGCDRKEYAGKTWYEYALYMLEQARHTPDSIFHMFMHSWELDKYPKGWQLFEDLLKEVTHGRYTK